MQWVEVLNRSMSWSDFDTAAQRASQSGRPLSATAHAGVVSDAALLWRLFTAHHLRGGLETSDRQRLLQWLEAVTLDVETSLAPVPRATVRLCGRRRRGALDEPFESELTSALLQLLATVGEPSLFDAIQRCHGVQRRGRTPLLSQEIEARFATHAGVDRLLDPAAGVTQCPRLFVSARGRHFCSKSCSNATFAARKALEDPQYFAAKQERYRLRRRSEAPSRPRQGAGAFVYMDMD